MGHFQRVVSSPSSSISSTLKTPVRIDRLLFTSAKQKQTTYEWLFWQTELVVKKQYETDVSVFDRDVFVKIDFQWAVVGALTTKRRLVG